MGNGWAQAAALLLRLESYSAWSVSTPSTKLCLVIRDSHGRLSKEQSSSSLRDTLKGEVNVEERKREVREVRLAQATSQQYGTSNEGESTTKHVDVLPKLNKVPISLPIAARSTFHSSTRQASCTLNPWLRSLNSTLAQEGRCLKRNYARPCLAS